MSFTGTLVRMIKDEIPIEILEIAFKDFKKYRRIVNIDTLIEKNIINSFYKDLNLQGGIKANIPLSDFNITYTNNIESVVELKKDIYPMKKIITVTEILQGNVMSSYGVSGRSPIDQLAGSIDKGTIGYFSSDVEVLSDRELYIEAPSEYLHGSEVVCYMSYGREMREIQPRYHLSLGALCLDKAKAIIYTKLIIKIDQGKIYHGHNMSTIQNIISGWSDSNKEYLEAMMVRGGKLLHMNDKRTMKESIGLLFNIR